MALIVAPEEGFDSLVSIDDAALYMAAYGHNWPDSGGLQEIALRQATQYILASYAIYPEYLDPVAPRAQDACCEAAARAAVGRLFADTDGRIITEQTVDVITTKWAEGAQGGVMRYPVIDALLRGMYDAFDGRAIRLVRG